MKDSIKNINIIKLLDNKKKVFEQKLQCNIGQLFIEIQKSKNQSHTDACLNLLENIQLELAKLLFKEKIELSDSLKKFIKDFDRIDDQETKKNLLEKIIIGELNYEKPSAYLYSNQ